MRHLVLLALLTGGMAACNDATAPTDDGQNLAASASAQSGRADLRPVRASLIEAGNQVSAAMKNKGVVAGLSARFAGDVLFLGPRTPTLHGKQAAIDWLSTNPIAPTEIQWEVLKADVSNDATQGYTWAGGTFTADLGTGPSELPGFFLLYWRRGPGGEWRIAAMVLNIAGPQVGPLPDGFGTPTTKQRRSFGETSDHKLLEIDAAFSAASVKRGTGFAFGRFAAENAMAVGGGQFIFGAAAIGEAFASEPTDVVSWIPRFSDVAGSGDLGFSVGDAKFDLGVVGTFYTKYLTVWQKQDNSRWRFVADFGNSRPAPAP
jgi:ketosteroid isomerase-like protein